MANVLIIYNRFPMLPSKASQTNLTKKKSLKNAYMQIENIARTFAH
jgi:hypothetical protein